MNQNLFCLVLSFSKLIFTKGSGVFRPLLYTLLFFFSGFIFGQITNDSVKTRPVISVKNGASIYSLDESFNEQIRNNNIVKDGKTTIAKSKNNRETVTIESAPKKENTTKKVKSFADSTKIKLEQENVNKVKKHLQKIESASKKQVYITPISGEKLRSSSFSKNYVTISFSHNDQKDFGYHQVCLDILKCLHALASQKITIYNSQALGYTVVSNLKVRPPPTA